MVLSIISISKELYKNNSHKFKFKHYFVIASIVGAALVGSVDATFRICGFLFCIIGNMYWIWHHKNITKDAETEWIFIGYLIINSIAIVNNYFWGIPTVPQIPPDVITPITP